MGDVGQNLEELDKIYGKCDNPHRNITRGDYEICKAEEGHYQDMIKTLTKNLFKSSSNLQ